MIRINVAHYKSRIVLWIEVMKLDEEEGRGFYTAVSYIS